MDYVIGIVSSIVSASETYPEIFVLYEFPLQLDISGELLEGRRGRIDASTIKTHSRNLPNEYRIIDDAHVLEAILSRVLPAKHINGVLALFYAFRSGATDQQIEAALVSKCFVWSSFFLITLIQIRMRIWEFANRVASKTNR